MAWRTAYETLSYQNEYPMPAIRPDHASHEADPLGCGQYRKFANRERQDVFYGMPTYARMPPNDPAKAAALKNRETRY